VKSDHDLCNNLKQTRIRLGMTQQDLANIAGVSRQTISGVESGQYAPSATIALRLAKALGCQLEELFWLEQDMPNLEATPAENMPVGQTTRLSISRIGGRWVAHPLVGNDAFRLEMVPADGEGEWLEDPRRLYQTVAIAGCTPALSLWAKAAERWHPELRVYWTFANSMAALHSLERGDVHLAGMHLYDEATQEYNIPFVRAAVQNTPAFLINLGIWEEGLLLQPGNPLAIKSVADLAQPEVKIVNREEGAGSRQVLVRSLQNEHIPPEAVKGLDHIVYSHLDVAYAVARGQVSAGVSTSAVAKAFGLDFIPLHQSRYDLVTLKPYLDDAPVQQLLDTLTHRRVLSQLKALGGYNTRQTGDIIATVEPQGAL
jgi:putative molybdopterin biosynthesis protein